MFDSKDLKVPLEVEITDLVAEGVTYFNSCYLPAEVLKQEGKFTIGIYGYILNEDESLKKRLSLKPIECTVVKGSYEEITDGAEVPDASVFEIYFNKIAEYETRIEDLFANANESLKKIKHFNSVADMKADTTLEATYYVKTLGYYEANDGGGADYLIREATAEDVDDGGSIHFIDNGLVAELIVEDSVNVKQFGAKGDGVTDDTVAIQTAINLSKKIIVDSNVYTTSGLQLINNTNIHFDNSTIKIIPNDKSAYSVIGIKNSNNINLTGNVHLVGDKDVHTGTTGEYGHCLSISASSNINIESLHCEYGWGDGLYIGANDDNVSSTDINIISLVCNNNRRNGFSISSGERITINNIVVYDNKGTSPNGRF